MAPSVGANAVSIVVVAAIMAAALAATGAAAAAGLVALLATSAAVVGGGSTARSDDDSPTGTPRPSDSAPSWPRGWAPAHKESLDATLAAAVFQVGNKRGSRSLKRPAPPGVEPCESRREARKVRFDLSLNSVHEITPYSEVYGLHPRLLGIQPGRDCLQRLDDGDCDSDEEEEEEADVFRRSLFSLLSFHGKAPRASWPLLVVTCFLLRAFGVSIIKELVLGGVSSVTGQIDAAWTKAPFHAVAH
eukprot:CAMPEP_0197631860 /NCGR_PEP_ID=MMETSP1338-20131121/8884_1 /TAXON_ID=43686 ORGANISM="Pelagodinium beii, Strain RCC1491" /NCGR_SAMPLE_ID=MMETSP1338 /ASSEMBLY_ACC=CAM_ASM_000754 /LENGTH=245 /DNA_ID=CAMNT_0043203399 /DNA_START=23 /DNA_END=760 /DNA_ORIENTATION=+